MAIATFAQKTIHDPNAEVRNVNGFNAVKVSTGIDLYLSAGEETVVVSGSTTEDRADIVTKVEDGVLKISYNWKDSKNKLSLNRGKALRAYVSYKVLNAIMASSGSDVFIDGSITGDKLSISVSSGSDLKGKVTIKNLVVQASGGSDVMLSGWAERAKIEVSGGSDFEGYDFQADIADVEASGGSDVTITVNKDLNVRSNGASDVFYKGKAVIKEISTGGASSVKKVGK